jgi:hypothetical protein
MSNYLALLGVSTMDVDVLNINTIRLAAAQPDAVLLTDSAKNVISKTLTDGELLIGVTGNQPIATTLTATPNQTTITNGAGSITIGTVQNIDVSANPTFANVTLSDLSSNLLVATDNSGNLQSLTTTSSNGVTSLIVGSVLGIDTPQDVRTTANVVFNTITGTNTTNQLILGNTRTVTVTAPTPATSSRIHTIPDITSNGTFTFLEGTQTFTGSKSFGSTLLPSSAGTIDIGSTTFPWRDLYMAKNNGVIQLGQGIRTANRAELFMNCNGDSVSDLAFGRDARIDANLKWSFSSRSSVEDNEFRLYRGPAVTGAIFDPIIRASGSTGQIMFTNTLDSTSTTTGSLDSYRGLGIAKDLFVVSNVNFA